MRKILFAAVALFLPVLAALALSPANAICSQSGEAVRSSQLTTTTYLYMRNTSVSSFYYYCITTNDDLQAAIRDAAANANRILAQGDASTCPTSGTSRYMGNCTYLAIRP